LLIYNPKQERYQLACSEKGPIVLYPDDIPGIGEVFE
jgi:hypothetical protein